MAATHFNSFERVFSRRELFRGKSVQALVWGVFASFALCLLLIDAFLVAELLETRGQVRETIVESQRFNDLFAEVPGDEPGAATESARAAGIGAPAVLASQEEAGLRPAVWRLRDVPILGSILAASYRHFSWFRENTKCLALLVLIGSALACLRGLCLWRTDTDSTRAALDIATRLRRTLHRQTLRLGPGDLTDPEGKQVIELFTQEVDNVRDGIQTWIDRLGRYPAARVSRLVGPRRELATGFAVPDPAGRLLVPGAAAAKPIDDGQKTRRVPGGAPTAAAGRRVTENSYRPRLRDGGF